MELLPYYDVVPFLEIFQLKSASESDLKAVIQAIWGWIDCPGCNNSGTCFQEECAWDRRSHLDLFLRHFQKATSLSIPEDLVEGHRAIRNHNDMINIIRLIIRNPDTARNELVRDHFSTESYGASQPEDVDKTRAFDLAIEVLTMTRGSSIGYRPRRWLERDSARDFVQTLFPQSFDLIPDRKFELSARLLEENHGIEIVGTDSFHKHLSLDTSGTKKILYIFHHISFLREYLISTKDEGSATPEIIPRKLAIETVNSLQYILFPLTDEFRSCFVEGKGFDRGCAELDVKDLRRDGEDNSEYHYWGTRLAVLYEEIEKPYPKRRSKCLRAIGGCKLLMVFTAIGVVLTGAALFVDIFAVWGNGEKRLSNGSR